jgi:WD40 repeat protein
MSIATGFTDDRLEDDDFAGISIVASKTGNNRVVKTCSVQIETDDLYEANVQTNTDHDTVSQEVQVDGTSLQTDQPEVDLERLSNFLDSVYPRLSNILEMNAGSRAFEHYEIQSSDLYEANTLQHTLTTTFEFTDPGIGEDDEDQGGDDTGSFQEYQDDIDEWSGMQSIGKRTKPSAADTASMQSRIQSSVANEETKTLSFDVTSIDWSCNGSTIAVAYGKQNHSSMSFQGCVSVWGVFRREMNSKKPSKNIEVGSSVTCLKFHPTEPSILAGGTFIGQIFLWDVYSDEPEKCNSRADEYFHRESITQLRWITQPQYGSFKFIHNIISCSYDGKILVWDPANKLEHPVRGHLLARKKKGAGGLVGGTSFDVNCSDKSMFVIGTEGGTLSFSERVSSGDFENSSKKLRWKKEAEIFMNTITNKVNQEQIKQEVERY